MRLSVNRPIFLIVALLGLDAILLGASGCAVMTDMAVCAMNVCQ